MHPLYDVAEVAYRGGGPFDGVVKFNKQSTASLPDCPPAEKLAHLMCFAWGADGTDGKSIVGKGYMLPAVPSNEVDRRAEAAGDNFKYMAYKYRVDSAELDGR